MKKYLLFLMSGWLLINFNSVSAQQSTFSKVYYDSLGYGIQTYSTIPALDSGYILAGSINSNNGGGDGLLMKLDTGGTVLWSKEIGGNNYDVFNCIIATNDSNYVVAGYSYNFSGVNTKATCLKINLIGDTIWSRELNFPGYNIVPLAIQQTADSGFIMTGYADSNGFYNQGILVSKLDFDGHLQWQKILKGTNGQQFGYSVKLTPDSGFIISGYVENSNPGFYNAVLIKLSQTGNIMWSNKYAIQTFGATMGYDVVVSDSSYLCYLLYGSFIEIMKTDISGNVLWSKSYSQYQNPFNNNTPTPKLHKTYDNGYAFVISNCVGSTLSKIDADGNMLWMKHTQIIAGDVLESPDSGLLIAGNGPLCGFFMPVSLPQIGLIKTDSLGNELNCVYPIPISIVSDSIITSPITFTEISGGTDSAIYPTVNSLAILNEPGCVPYVGGIHENNYNNNLSIYPNPSNGNFILSSSNIIKNGEVEIYNVLGESIYKTTFSNSSKLEIQLHQIQPGIYFVKVLDGAKQYSQKLMVK